MATAGACIRQYAAGERSISLFMSIGKNTPWKNASGIAVPSATPMIPSGPDQGDAQDEVGDRFGDDEDGQAPELAAPEEQRLARRGEEREPVPREENEQDRSARARPRLFQPQREEMRSEDEEVSEDERASEPDRATAAPQEISSCPPGRRSRRAPRIAGRGRRR